MNKLFWQLRYALNFWRLTKFNARVPKFLISKPSSIEKMLACGPIKYKTFYLRKPLIITQRNPVVIQNCNFIAVAPMRYMIEVHGVGHTILIDHADNISGVKGRAVVRTHAPCVAETTYWNNIRLVN